MLNLIVFKWDEVIIYLRKSRTDSPNETVEEVLAKHEKMLQEKAVAMFGKEIPEENIYREVVSGETIEDRPAMIEVLSRIEDPNIKAILVIEPQRLSRGDLEDCGKIVNSFRYSNTQVVTLQMTYDLNVKMHRKFFEQELLRGNDYLEYTKEILHRGRMASVQKGCYISPVPPYGYNKIMLGDNPTLEPNEYADVVKLIFDLYVNKGMAYGAIATHLDEMGVKPYIREYWESCSVRNILVNPHYIGLVRYGLRKVSRTYENNKIVKKRIYADDEEVIIAKGLHEAIIDEETFDKAQNRINNNPRTNANTKLRNPFAGVLRCHKCGKIMDMQTFKHTKSRVLCAEKSCTVKSIMFCRILDAVVFALENEHMPELESKLNNDDGLSANIQRQQLEILTKELEEMKKQENKQYDLLEKELYTEAVFKSRHDELVIEMEKLKSRIYTLKQTTPKEIDYADKIIKLQDAIAGLKDDSISVEAKNILVKAIIEKIEYEFIERKGQNNVIFKLHIFLRL